jgi:hypothetical protein
MPHKLPRHRKEFINAYTASVIINWGGVEFDTLYNQGEFDEAE